MIGGEIPILRRLGCAYGKVFIGSKIGNPWQAEIGVPNLTNCNGYSRILNLQNVSILDPLHTLIEGE